MNNDGYMWFSFLLLIIILSYLVATLISCFYTPKTIVIKNGEIMIKNES